MQGIVHLRSTFPPSARQPLPVYLRGGRLPELRVVEHWLRCVGTGDPLRTVTGASLRVLHPGTRNRFEGPDFLDARLEVDGLALSGDIEIHTREEDWRAHGHQHDARYRRVVLHVALYGSRTRVGQRAGGTGDAPHVVALDAQPARPVRSLWQGPLTAPHPMRCAGGAHAVPRAVIAAAVTLAAERRFSAKIGRLRARVDQLRRDASDQGWSAAFAQAVYEGCARALGYGGNEDAMEALARALPLARLAPLPVDAAARLLLATAGIALDDRAPRLDAPGLASGEVTDPAAPSGPGMSLHRAGIRPNNRALRRLPWLAHAAGVLALPDFTARLAEAARRRQRGGRRDPLRMLFRFDGCPAPLRPGPDRMTELCTNVFAPALAVLAVLSGEAALRDAAATLFHAQQPAPASSTVSRMAPVLGIPSPMTTGTQQGLIELWTHGCGADACANCLVHAVMHRESA